MDLRRPQNIYRLQFADGVSNSGSAVLEQLADRGVDWVILPAEFTADVAALQSASAQARRHGMGVLVDTMSTYADVAVASGHDGWWDLLALGRASSSAETFEVDWAAGEGQVLIPVVEDGDEDGVVIREGAVHYRDLRFPLAPGTRRLRDQHYRLLPRSAHQSLNYRRQAGDPAKAALRVEAPEVFEQTHRAIRSWTEQGLIDGLWVGTLDEIPDPDGYLHNLTELAGAVALLGPQRYDASGLIEAALIGAAPGSAPEEGRRAIAESVLGSELRWIARELPALPPIDPSTVERPAKGFVSRVRQRFSGPSALPLGHPTERVLDALAGLVASVPVPRAHLPQDGDHLERAFDLAAADRPDLTPVFEALAPVLADSDQSAALRFQLTCAALAAIERPIETPAPGSCSLENFHEAMTIRQRADGGLINDVSGPEDSAQTGSAASVRVVSLTMPGIPLLVDRGELLAGRDNEALVFAATVAGLRLRRDRPDLFTTYTSVEVVGEGADHLLAFDRGGALTVATRRPEALQTRGGWGQTELVLPAGDWWDHVTGRDLGSDGRVYVAELLDQAPTALLTRDDR